MQTQYFIYLLHKVFLPLQKKFYPWFGYLNILKMIKW